MACHKATPCARVRYAGHMRTTRAHEARAHVVHTKLIVVHTRHVHTSNARIYITFVLLRVHLACKKRVAVSIFHKMLGCALTKSQCLALPRAGVLTEHSHVRGTVHYLVPSSDFIIVYIDSYKKYRRRDVSILSL